MSIDLANMLDNEAAMRKPPGSRISLSFDDQIFAAPGASNEIKDAAEKRALLPH